MPMVTFIISRGNALTLNLNCYVFLNPSMMMSVTPRPTCPKLRKNRTNQPKMIIKHRRLSSIMKLVFNMNQPTVYVVVPTTKERRPRLQKMIESVRASDYPNVTLVIHEGVHPGYVSAVHEAVKDLNGLCFFINDDMVIASNCIPLLVWAFQKHFPDQLGVVSP